MHSGLLSYFLFMKDGLQVTFHRKTSHKPIYKERLNEEKPYIILGAKLKLEGKVLTFMRMLVYDIYAHRSEVMMWRKRKWAVHLLAISR